MIINKIRDIFIMLKIYFGRSQSYLSIINSSMIIYLTLYNLKQSEKISFDISSYFLLITIIGFFLLIVIGWIEVKFLKGLNKELQYGSELNPFMMELKNKIDYLYIKKIQEDK